MQHATPTFPATALPNSTPDQPDPRRETAIIRMLTRAAEPDPDAGLIAMASELKDALQAFRDHDETTQRARDALNHRLHLAAEAASGDDPTTFAGLLIFAHGAAVLSEHDWEADLDEVGQDGILLRRLANGLFQLAGVDWRGRPLPVTNAGAPSVRESDPQRDAAIGRMLTRPEGVAAPEAAVRPVADGADPRLVALVADWQTAEAAFEASSLPDAEGRPLYDEICRLHRAVYAFPSRTLADLLAKLPAFRDEAEALGAPPTATDREPTLEACAIRGFVADLERLSAGAGASTARPASDAPPNVPADPIFAAIEASREALHEHGEACKAAADGSFEHEARVVAATAASSKAWRELLGMTPATIAGALALSQHAVDHMENHGCWDDSIEDGDAIKLFRAIGAAGPYSDREPPPGTMRVVDAEGDAFHPIEVGVRLEGQRLLRLAWQDYLNRLQAVDETDPAYEERCALVLRHRLKLDALFEVAAQAGAKVEIACDPSWEMTGRRLGLPEMAAELHRVDAAIALLLKGERRESHEVPGYLAMEANRGALLAALTETQARHPDDIRAKAEALLAVKPEDHKRHGDLADSLAEDIGRLPRPVQFGAGAAYVPDDPTRPGDPLLHFGAPPEPRERRLMAAE